MENRKDTGKVGRKGEDLVCLYLMRLGHTILARNWRSGHLEIDIVSMNRDGVHFVEVKSRRAPMTADPVESVGSAKQRKIISAAIRYAGKAGLEDVEFFFDVAAVVFDGKTTEIRYYPQAYIPIR